MAVVVTLGVVILGAVATYTNQRRDPPEAAEAAPSAIQVSAAAEPPRPPPTMPDGWRALRFGMSEMDVRKVVHEYRHDAAVPWEQSRTTQLPTVRPSRRTIDDVAVDGKRYHQWSIRELDDGTGTVHAWHADGSLIALQLQGRAEPGAFLRMASAAYGSPPEHVEFTFFDDRTRMQQRRDVAVWRGRTMTAFLWTSAASPVLLLWSNTAMASREAEYEAALDAPAAAASKAAGMSERGTQF